MKLSEKDAEFLARLRVLLAEKDLRVDLKQDVLKRLVLRQNYGQKIFDNFGMTRQGVRWRFQRLADIYVSAYETIYWVETNLGTDLRSKALAIAQERAALRKEAMNQSRSGRR